MFLFQESCREDTVKSFLHFFRFFSIYTAAVPKCLAKEQSLSWGLGRQCYRLRGRLRNHQLL